MERLMERFRELLVDTPGVSADSMAALAVEGKEGGLVF